MGKLNTRAGCCVGVSCSSFILRDSYDQVPPQGKYIRAKMIKVGEFSRIDISNDSKILVALGFVFLSSGTVIAFKKRNHTQESSTYSNTITGSITDATRS